MAATILSAPVLRFVFFYFLTLSISSYKDILHKGVTFKSTIYTVWTCSSVGRKKLPSRPICTWTKHGHICNNTNIRLVTVYRPPLPKRNNHTAAKFFEDFSTLLEVLTISNHSLLITGDFNFHMDGQPE